MFEHHPRSDVAWETLVRTQIAAGQREKAVASLRTASQADDGSGNALLRVAAPQITASDYDGARSTLQKAAATERRNDATAAMVQLHLTTGDVAGARALAEAFRSREPDNAMAHRLLAEVMVREGNFAGAIDSYRKSQQLAQSVDAVVGIFEARMSAGERKGALEELQAWVDRHPREVRAKRALGLGYIADGQLDRAESIHTQLLAAQPDAPLLLNNLARIYQLGKDPRARSFAQRAVDRAGTWPIALDTLGWILVTEGQAAEGLRLLRDAHTRAAENPLIRYHLAAALSELGRNREALAELDYLLSAYGGLDWIDQVRSLRADVAAR